MHDGSHVVLVLQYIILCHYTALKLTAVSTWPDRQLSQFPITLKVPPYFMQTPLVA